MATKNKGKKAAKAGSSKGKKATSSKVTSIKAQARKASKPKLAKPKAKTAAKSKVKKPAAGKVISLAQARESRQPKIDWNTFFTPVDDRVLLEVTKAPEKTPGGLFIPDSAQSKSSHARVLAVGPGKRDKKGRRRPIGVQVGEKVLYAEYAGSKLELGGRDLLLVNETDILGVLET